MSFQRACIRHELTTLGVCGTGWDPGTLTRSLNCSGNDRKYRKPMASEIVVYTVRDEREIGIRKVDGDVVFKRLFAAHSSVRTAGGFTWRI
jgi:hypothetical protein